MPKPETIEVRPGDWWLITASVNAWNELYHSAEEPLRSRMDEILAEKRHEALLAAMTLFGPTGTMTKSR